MPRALKWLAVGLGGLLALVLMVAGILYLVGSSRVDRVYAVESANLTVRTDSATLARGAHLARTNGCADCHGENLGGQVLVDAPPFRVVAANLTSGRGGVGGRYSVEELDRAIRHGIRPDGRPLFIMPSAAFHQLSDEDVAALIAHLQSVPPVDNELPPTEVRAMGRILAAVRLLDPEAEVRTRRPRTDAAPPAGATPEYGAYIASGTCAYCHGQEMRGNPRPPNPDSPPAPDLVAAATRWSLEQFRQTLRTGRTPEGNELDPRYMPWSLTAAMEDYELAALYEYLAAQGRRPTAAR